MIGAILGRRAILKNLEALNNRDLDPFIDGFSEDVVLIHPGEVPGVSGRHEGKEALRAFYEKELEQFPQFKLAAKQIAVSRIFDFTGGSNTVAMHWEADVTNKEGYRLLNSGVSIMTIRNHKAVRMQNTVFDTGEKFLTAWGVKRSSD